MLKKLSIYLFVFLLIGSCTSVMAQLPIFQMVPQQDVTITNCKGEFHDSDAGPGNNYLAQAKDTFRICTGGNISMIFQQFQLESGFDTLFFYNGTTISNGTLIGKFTGSNTPTGIAASGCLTIVFKSSFALQDLGWVAQWTSTVIPPVPPTFSVTPVPSCSTSTVDIVLSKKIHCDSVYASAFTLTGPTTATVTGALDIGCASDSTSTIQLQLSQPLLQSCNYNVIFTINMRDNCDSVWTFTVNNSFTITDCPLTVNITATPNDTVCSGACVQLKAVLNSCLSYDYLWSHGMTNAAVQTVCPITTTTYTLDVQSTSGGPLYNTTVTITVLNPQITPPAQSIVCQSAAPFNFMASPPGGKWRGKGITDSIQGTFDPDTAMQGVHTIYYSINGLCSDSFAITVLPMDAGFDEAACPGTPPFSLSGYTPAGGTWSGYVGLSAGGVFNPTTIGTYTVTYTHPNGCSETKQVFVQPLVVSAVIDSICESLYTDTLTVSPPGGRWVPALGITDTINGVLDPGIAGPGMHHFLYKLNGCMDTAHIYIKPMNAGSDQAFCPLQPGPLSLGHPSPAGGIWTNLGTDNGGTSGLINSSGQYNPGIQGLTNFTDTLLYSSSNGCSDTMISYVLRTNIVEDTLFFCQNDDSILLEWSTVQNYPGGGSWTGNGITSYGTNYYFKPSDAGIGIHTLVYLINTCSDTIRMIVHPDKLSYDDTTLCTMQNPFLLDSIGVNANWQGTGIVNTSNGLFDPSVSGPGTFPIVYSSPNGCKDTINVTVYTYIAAQIGGLNNVYCYRNFNYPITLAPAGGTFTGSGISGNTFNPSLAGAGLHQLIYTFGSGPCFTSDTLNIQVHPPIQTTASASNDSICKSGGSTITINSSGGDPSVNGHTYTWSHGLFATNVNVVSPSTTTTYTITTSDGCSDAKTDLVTITVHPGFTQTFTTSPTGCNGASGTASVNVIGSNSYSYLWSTNPATTTNSITGISGSTYSVTITDITTGCYFDTTITIPGYGIINSSFSINPNLPCIAFEQNPVSFIDLSLGATQGYWELSNGITIPYTQGANLQYSFTQPGTYTMKLHVENAGNCADETTQDICVLEPVIIFIPDIFSPNGDGLNDVLFVRTTSVKEFSFILFDRWGERVFETTNSDKGWDGKYNNTDTQTGVYVWYFSVTYMDGAVETRKGDITLVR
ncbi:MAG: gliding motility-associated C-terminal domain-containing protein [Bacteroidota bacterium]